MVDKAKCQIKVVAPCSPLFPSPWGNGGEWLFAQLEIVFIRYDGSSIVIGVADSSDFSATVIPPSRADVHVCWSNDTHLTFDA